MGVWPCKSIPGAGEVFWFFLFVAVMNMIAGFGVAVMLAGQCAMRHDFQHGDGETGISAYPEVQAPESVDPDVELRRDDAESPNQEEPAIEALAAAAPAVDEPQGQPDTETLATPSATSADNAMMNDLDAAVLAALGEGALADPKAEAPSPEREDVVQKRPDGALLVFQSRLQDFCAELVALDDQLRRMPPREAGELKSQLEAFAACSKRQDEACSDAAHSLRELITAETIDARRGEAMIAAIQEERQDAAEAFQSFAELDDTADATTQCEMILDQTAGLLAANFDLRDGVSDMVSCPDPQQESGKNPATIDPLTEVWSRDGVDGILAQHWRDDPDRLRAASFMVIDLDHFGQLNRRHGAAIGDRVLRAVAQLLKSELPPECRVGRFAGQRFAVFAVDRELKQAVGDAEYLRQTIDMARFEYGAENVKVTVSCGVVAVAPDDTQESLYARALEAVQEAKRYGRNRCSMHEGEFSTPVVPPNLALNERHVTL